MSFSNREALAVAPPALDAGPAPAPEPLVSLADAEEFRAGLEAYRSGRWDEARWTTFRLRFGIYKERRDGLHMIRLKLPGGGLDLAVARRLARLAESLADGAVHITTRQGVQLYGIDLDALGPLVDGLTAAGITSREASGNTFRAVCACPLAGHCPREGVDAGAVAERLTTAWLRHPLVQHMPRKFKTAVSGCAHDCAGARIDDLGVIAVEDEAGQRGFRVVAGGGLGSRPRIGVTVFDFVAEEDLPTVQEAIARVHNAHSDRKRRHAARIKVLVERLGAEEFVRLVHREYAWIHPLPRRPWAPLSWKTPAPGAVPTNSTGADSTGTVVARPALGWLRAGDLDALAVRLAEAGARAVRLTRDQGIVVGGLSAAAAEALATDLAGRGIPVAGGDGFSDVGACTGASLCPIGITDSRSLASVIEAELGPRLPDGVRVRVSGCHNSCGHHHLADIGLHGDTRKIDGVPVPHYVLHLGGVFGAGPAVGVEGPSIPAVNVIAALTALLETWDGVEPLAVFARRHGADGLTALLAPYLTADKDAVIEPGTDRPFAPPKSAAGECGAPAVVAEHLADAAAVAREDVGRALSVGDEALALESAFEAVVASARRLLAVSRAKKAAEGPADGVIEALRRRGDEPALDAALLALHKAESGDWDGLAPALDAWIARAVQAAEAAIAAHVKEAAAWT